MDSQHQSQRDYSRLASTAFRHTTLETCTALVAGAGALGNEVIKNLALLGIGRVVIVDRDRVERSNLTRSILFCTPSIEQHILAGMSKADLAAMRVREINPDVAVSPLMCEVADLGLGVLRRADIVFSCLDNELARLELGWACTRMDRPLVESGLGLINYSSGQVSVFPGAQGPCYACRKGSERRRQLIEELQSREDSCTVKARRARAEGAVPTTPLIASAVAGLQVEIGLRRWIDPTIADRTIGTAHRLTFHPRPMLDTGSFERSPSCPLHDPASVAAEVREFPDRRCGEWTPEALLSELELPRGSVQFDWPMSAQAVCRACAHRWEPFVRRARFLKGGCPACRSLDVADVSVVTQVDASSPLAGRTFADLGQPPGQVFEIVVDEDPDAARVHVEATGDLLDWARPGLRC